MENARVDIFDDPAWVELPEPPRPLSVRLPLRLTGISTLGVALSTLLPWYGFWGAGWGRWELQDEVSAVSGLLPHAVQPGGDGWGYLLIGVSVAVLVLARLLRFFVGTRARSVSMAMRVFPVLATTSTALLIIAVLGLSARPPIGDGPPYVYDQGAVVGLTAAGVCVVASLWAWGAMALNAQRVTRRQYLEGSGSLVPSALSVPKDQRERED